MRSRMNVLRLKVMRDCSELFQAAIFVKYKLSPMESRRSFYLFSPIPIANGRKRRRDATDLASLYPGTKRVIILGQTGILQSGM